MSEYSAENSLVLWKNFITIFDTIFACYKSAVAI